MEKEKNDFAANDELGADPAIEDMAGEFAEDETPADYEFDGERIPASVELDEEEVPPTDITFECPTCGKGLSIDPRGAGLTVTCTQCGNLVAVPIPDGMEIDDFDATPEELSMLLVRTRQNLLRAQSLLAVANAELEELREFKQATEEARVSRYEKLERAQLNLSDIIKMNREIGDALSDMGSNLFESEELE
ncbi:MAG: hypothetical protein GX804_03195 [Lentisphaerae bacterium]|jgi:hypothetical protein|nr:hypothetical protein [Lentisphaerota bacterium]